MKDGATSKTLPFALAFALVLAELLVSCSVGKSKKPFPNGAAIVSMQPIPNPPEANGKGAPLPVPPIPPANLINEYRAANLAALSYAARTTPDSNKLLTISAQATQARQAIIAFQKNPSDEKALAFAERAIQRFKESVK